MTFFIALFVLLMQFVWKYVDDMVGKGFEWNVILELLFYASSTFVPLALPLAVLLSSLMAFGNLGENYELVAIKSSGISLQRAMQPLVVFIFVISVAAFFFSNNILPRANLKFRTLLKDVRQKKPAVAIKEGVFYSEITDYVIKVGKKDPDGISIHDVIIYNHTKGIGNSDITIAKDGKMEISKDKKFLVFTLFDGYNYNENVSINNGSRNNLPSQKTLFKKEIRRLNLSAFDFKKTNEDLYRDNYEMLNITQLSYFKDSLENYQDSSAVEFNNYVIDEFSFLKNYNRIITTKPIINHKNDSNAVDKSNTVGIKEIQRGIGKIDFAKIVPESTAVVYTIDTTKLLGNNILSIFDNVDQQEIVSTALQKARSSSYRTDITTDTMDAINLLIIKHKNEWNRKFALSFACIILFFIGAPLGAIIRKGGLGMPVVVSVIMFVTFHIFSIIGEKFSKEGIVEPFVGIWLASALFLPLGIFLTIKATSDSPLFDSEAYQKVFIWISNLFKKMLSQQTNAKN